MKEKLLNPVDRMLFLFRKLADVKILVDDALGYFGSKKEIEGLCKRRREK